MNREEIEFLNHISGIKGYVEELKNRELGYRYDNINEFKDLLFRMKSLETENKEIISWTYCWN